MSRKKMNGALDTSTVLLIGAGVLVIYLMNRKPTPTLPPPYLPGGSVPVSSGASPTNTAITSGASIINNLINQIFG